MKQTSLRGLTRMPLPNEPLAEMPALQHTLTERHLLPRLAELDAFFLALRARIDRDFLPLRPVKAGKPYPLGHCLEISKAAQQLLRQLDAADYAGAAADGLRAYTDFLRAGGTMRQIWGDLRGQFFQNAFQLGTLYVDVSNDTVTVTKPKVEILPFADARMVAIRDFHHFARIAERYWRDRVHPNHVLPGLAPYCPFIHITPQGHVKLYDNSDYMIALAHQSGFDASADVLRAPAMPAELFAVVAGALAGSGHVLATDPEQGRAEALRACRTLRAGRKHLRYRIGGEPSAQVDDINRKLLAAIRPAAASTPAHSGERMTNEGSVDIDGVRYALADLSAAARAQLDMITVTDTRLKELQRDFAITQTARTAYMDALKTLLPVPAKS